MARYFFDIFANGRRTLDDEGAECGSFDEARKLAMKTLPAIAKDQVPKDGDNQAYTVLIRSDAGKAVFSATLTVTALTLDANKPAGRD